MQQRLFVCKNCGRDTITQPHHDNCPVGAEERRKEQTNLKCREFGVPPYYQEARPFPRQPP